MSSSQSISSAGATTAAGALRGRKGLPTVLGKKDGAEALLRGRKGLPTVFGKKDGAAVPPTIETLRDGGKRRAGVVAVAMKRMVSRHRKADAGEQTVGGGLTRERQVPGL
jgi:hypothetical protein